MERLWHTSVKNDGGLAMGNGCVIVSVRCVPPFSIVGGILPTEDKLPSEDAEKPYH
jgi:hypothetical protein